MGFAEWFWDDGNTNDNLFDQTIVTQTNNIRFNERELTLLENELRNINYNELIKTNNELYNPIIYTGMTFDGSLGIVSSSVGFKVSTQGNINTVNPITNINIGISTPGIGFSAFIGGNLPFKNGNENHTYSLTLFGIGGSLTISENGLSAFSLFITSYPKIDYDYGIMGINYTLYSY